MIFKTDVDLNPLIVPMRGDCGSSQALRRACGASADAMHATAMCPDGLTPNIVMILFSGICPKCSNLAPTTLPSVLLTGQGGHSHTCSFWKTLRAMSRSLFLMQTFMRQE